MRKFVKFALASVPVLFACTTASQKTDVTAANGYPERTIASITNYSKTDPESHKTFWQEYSDAGLGLESSTVVKNDLLGKRIKVIFKWVRSNPISMFEDVRQMQPILVTRPIPIKKPVDGENNATIVVSLYKDVTEILENPTIFSVRNYTKKIDGAVGPFMLAHDAAKYNTVEKPWMRKMMPREDLPRVRQIVKDLTIQAIVNGTFDAMTPDGKTYGRLEVVENVARRVPLQLTGKYFGFPGPDLGTMARWSKALQDDFFHNVTNEPDIAAKSKAQGKEMNAYVAQLINQRREEMSRNPNAPADDVLSRLIKGGTNPDEILHFSDDRINSNIVGTLIGGVETTEAAIVQSMEQLFARPQRLAEAIAAARAGNDDLVAKYVWEALRFNPVNPFVVRYAEQDYVLAKGTSRETLIKKGSIVLVGTMSAMFDESVVPNPLEFRVDRPDSTYFHLGYGHHRCLGDYVSEVQVPEIVKQLLLKDGIRPASGAAGQVDMKEGHFPETFVVEYDNPAPVPANHVQIYNNWFAFEDYLMDFNRDEFRKCLTGSSFFEDPKVNQEANALNNFTVKHNKDYRRALLFCRLNAKFRACMDTAYGKTKANIMKADAFHAAAFAKCDQAAPLTATEKAFYKQVMFDKPLDVSTLSPSQAKRTSGWDFEDVLKFYDRYTYRECYMNPAAPHSFPDNKEMIFYARLPMAFRNCIGYPVVGYKLTQGLIGKDRPEQFKICENGVYNSKNGRYEGGLSKAEKYYYRSLVLHENVQYSQVEN